MSASRPAGHRGVGVRDVGQEAGLSWPDGFRRTLPAPEDARELKRNVLLFWLIGMVLITVAHIGVNVGWDRLVRNLRESVGLERKELYVGFLPVT